MAGKKAAEERIGHLERQLRDTVSAVQMELVEARALQHSSRDGVSDDFGTTSLSRSLEVKVMLSSQSCWLRVTSLRHRLAVAEANHRKHCGAAAS